MRKAKKLSQGDLGKEVGTSGDIIGRYERDEVTPSVEVASRLTDALGVSLDYLSAKTDTELDNAALGRIRDITVMPARRTGSRFSSSSMPSYETSRQGRLTPSNEKAPTLCWGSSFS